MSTRPTFDEARARFIHRFTCEHIPTWSQTRPCEHGGTETRYYAPQYRTDREWYDNTAFYGDPAHVGNRRTCTSINQSWPLGQWLEQHYKRSAL